MDMEVLLEPGRSIVADAGLLVAEVLYVKRQAGQTFYIIDASMSELIRAGAVYEAHHEVAPLRQRAGETVTAQVVGPVCESADVLARDRQLPRLRAGEFVALMTAGAYGMAMASNYNARPRPAEVVVGESGRRVAGQPAAGDGRGSCALRRMTAKHQKRPAFGVSHSMLMGRFELPTSRL